MEEFIKGFWTNGEMRKKIQPNCFLFEFHQGNQPRTVWKHGPEINFLDELMWYVVTIPAVQDASISRFRPVSLISMFKNMHFLAIYGIIPDIEARGFSRTVCLCILHDEPVFYQFYVNGVIDQLNNVVKQIRESALPCFSRQLSEYSGRLSATINVSPESANLLRNIELELQVLLKEMEIIPDMNQQSDCIDFFNKINNDLRPIEQLFDFKYLKSSIENILHNISICMFSGIVCGKAGYRESMPSLSFAGIGNLQDSLPYQKFASLLLSNSSLIDNNRYSMVNLIKSRIIHHCAYTLMTGRSLVIESDNPSAICSFAKRFSLFIPFFDSTHFLCLNEAVDSSTIPHRYIIVSPCYSRDNQDKVSVLNYDKGFYEGVICPSTSFIYKDFDFKSIKKETSLLLYIYQRIKELSSCIYIDLNKIGEPKFSISSMKLLPDDDIIINYWIGVALNQLYGKKEPQFVSNTSGIGIVTFFE